MQTSMEERVFVIQGITILAIFVQDVHKALNLMEELVHAQEILI
jgi:hypothetical protein